MVKENFIFWIIALSTLLLSSCASRPVIDTKGIDIDAYKTDLAECEQVAEQLESGKNIAKSAGFGALLRGTLGALIDPENVGTHAAIGATEGTALGALKNDEEESSIVKKCLKNRGYKVLN
jgi:hypothetical protein